MNKLKTTKYLIIFTFFIGSITYAQKEKTNEHTKLSIEIDPATFILDGYSMHVRIQPKNCNHLLLGFGTYALDLPDLLVNFNKKNKGKGWNTRINQGYSLFAEHHFTEVNNKWFVGTQIGIQEFKIEKETINRNKKFTSILAMSYLGYTLKPFKNNLYIKPWAGIGYTSKISGNNKIEAFEYDIAPITLFLTLHVGYTF